MGQKWPIFAKFQSILNYMHVIYHTAGNLQLIAFLHELELTRVSRNAISYKNYSIGKKGRTLIYQLLRFLSQFRPSFPDFAYSFYRFFFITTRVFMSYSALLGFKRCNCNQLQISHCLIYNMHIIWNGLKFWKNQPFLT